MTAADAQAVADWRYSGPYAFYDFDADPDDLAELLDPSGWGHRYFAVDDANDDLVGFLACKPKGDDVEIGLGLRPDLTGRGLGRAFTETGLRFAAERFEPSSFSLAVAAFNRRAITVYQRAGFGIVRQYQHETNGGVHPFVAMTRGPLGT